MDEISKYARCSGVILLRQEEKKINGEIVKDSYAILGHPSKIELKANKSKRQIETFAGKTEGRDIVAVAVSEMLEETGMNVSYTDLYNYMKTAPAFALGFSSGDTYLYNVFFLVKVGEFNTSKMKEAYLRRLTLYEAGKLDKSYVEMADAIAVNLSCFTSGGNILIKNSLISLPRERPAFIPSKIKIMRKFLADTNAIKWDGSFCPAASSSIDKKT